MDEKTKSLREESPPPLNLRHLCNSVMRKGVENDGQDIWRIA